MSGVLGGRATRLFIVLSGFFVANAIIAEFVGVKIFALEATLGTAPFGWSLFGQTGSLSFTAGVLWWPVVFIMTDVINEYFGRRGVRFISLLTVGLIAYAFIAAYLAIGLAPAAWWVTVNEPRGVPDMQAAFANVFGQGMWTIGGSITAFLIGQLVDVTIFHRIRRANTRALDLAARHRFDGRLAAHRQLRGALHRLRAGTAAVADVALPRRRHGQLPVQDVRRGGADSAHLPDAPSGRDLSRRSGG